MPHIVLIDSVEQMVIKATDKNIQAALFPGRYCWCTVDFNANIFCLPIAPGHDILLFDLIDRLIA
jgi:hypothetical protein